ncbi:MAG: hypothetical protein K2L85_01880, partial [Paramuribaculum sp.]|nr:hypothetical protein [Paramuribaculum sp.]
RPARRRNLPDARIRSAAAGHPAPDTARRSARPPIGSPPVLKAPEGFPLLSAAVCAQKKAAPITGTAGGSSERSGCKALRPKATGADSRP